jgi:hypothetical protein
MASAEGISPLYKLYYLPFHEALVPNEMVSLSFCPAEHLQLYLKGAAIWRKRNAPTVTYKGIINT